MKSNVAYALQILAGGLFVAAGAAKLAGAEIMVQEFDLVGLGQSARILVGLIEIIGGLCLIVPRAGVLGARNKGDDC
jgi:putative oxidoreductase